MSDKTDKASRLGAVYLGEEVTSFRVWAPRISQVQVHLLTPSDRIIPLNPMEFGYHEATVRGVSPGARYVYQLGNVERPDPASRSQPEGVHGPSEVVDPAFEWNDAGWKGIRLEEYVVYELHVGTFTPEGTFDAVVAHLPRLKDLGITAIELMPVAQVPGWRNWGYDGVYPFAVQSSYGGIHGLKRFVNACHSTGLAVILDVVYNHLGPEGNYLAEYGPYYSEGYRTPWGKALNFDGSESDEVRHYFLTNALGWFEEFHFDALRLDAVQAIKDFSASPFLAELSEATDALSAKRGRPFYLIAETDQNDPRLITQRRRGGLGFHAQWSDDFHHAIHALLTGERRGYYSDFGEVSHLARAYRDGFTYTGEYSHHRKRRHGHSPWWHPAEQFVVCSQNHDQVGNRALGERLGQLVGFEGAKLAAAMVLLSPYIPFLFMGEEYGEIAPFLYFTSHGDLALGEAVRLGRRREFAEFHRGEEVPDPQDEATFRRSQLNHKLLDVEPHRTLHAYYRSLLTMRREIPVLARPDLRRSQVRECEQRKLLWVRRWDEKSQILFVANFGAAPGSLDLELPSGRWVKRLDSAHSCWSGPGSELPDMLISEGEFRLTVAPHGAVLYHHGE